MMTLFCGPRGSGKTQKLIDTANDELNSTDGLIVYIDKSDKHRLSIDNQIRFINAREFGIAGADAFFGFLCGLMAGNYDINRVYVDNIKQIVKLDDSGEIHALLKKVKSLSEISDVKFFFTLDAQDVSLSHEEEYILESI